MLAQDSGYAPPPMFDDMTPPMVRPQAKDGYIVEPKISPNTKLPEQMNAPVRPPVVLPRVSVDPNSQAAQPKPQPQKPPVAPAAPKPAAPPVVTAPPTPAVPTPAAQAPQKPAMMKPIVDEVYIKRDARAVPAPSVKAPVPPKKPAAPAPVKKEDQAVSATTVTKEAVGGEDRTAAVPQRDPKDSAIKGPKEMPALPQETVQTEKTFETDQDAGKEQTMLERNQVTARDKPLIPVVPRPKSNVTPASLEQGEQNVLKKLIPYEPGQITLPDAETDPIAAAVVKELDDEDKEAWRVQIKSYATPHGTGVSSDRRIALSRALSLRSSLITQGVSAGKIDVLAEGQQSDPGKPADRIDLYIYGPKED